MVIAFGFTLADNAGCGLAMAARFDELVLRSPSPSSPAAATPAVSVGGTQGVPQHRQGLPGLEMRKQPALAGSDAQPRVVGADSRSRRRHMDPALDAGGNHRCTATWVAPMDATRTLRAFNRSAQIDYSRRGVHGVEADQPVVHQQASLGRAAAPATGESSDTPKLSITEIVLTTMRKERPCNRRRLPPAPSCRY